MLVYNKISQLRAKQQKVEIYKTTFNLALQVLLLEMYCN